MVDKARILVRKAIMVLPPDVRGQQVVERGDWRTPPHLPCRLQPLGVLVEHRIDNVDERLVTGEETVAPGEQIAFEPPLAQVLTEHLHDPALRSQTLIDGPHLGGPRLVGHLQDSPQPVRLRLVRAEDAKVPDCGIGGHHIAQKRPEHPCRLGIAPPRAGHRHGVGSEVGQDQILTQHPAVGVRVGAHATRTPRGEIENGLHGPARCVEQLLGAIAFHPGFQQLDVIGLGRHLREGHLMGAPGIFYRLTVDHLRPRPSLRTAQNDHRPTGTARLGGRLDAGHLIEAMIHCGRHFGVHLHGFRAFDENRRVAIATKQFEQLGPGNAIEQSGVGNLIAVQVQHRQHDSVPRPVEELIGMPTGRAGAGLCLAIAHHAHHNQVRVIERRAVGVQQRIAQFPALVNGPRRLGRDVARNAVGPGELAK